MPLDDPDLERDPYQLYANACGDRVPWAELAPAERAWYALQREVHPVALDLARWLDRAVADRDEATEDAP